MYEARKVANYVLAQYDAARFGITNLRLNKLLYFMHGWALTSEPGGLVRNHFEAWTFGPVLPSIYREFKRYGEKPISSLAEYTNYATGAREPVPTSEITEVHRSLIARTFDYYANYSTAELVGLSHEPDGAWTAALQAVPDGTKHVRIPNIVIRQHFLLIVGQNQRH